MIILGIWIVIGLFFAYSFGSAWGGREGGIEALIAFATMIIWYGGWGTLIYFTLKEIAKHIV